MKSLFAIKKDVLLRIIESSEFYERSIGGNFLRLDCLVEDSALLECEKCGYIIRIPEIDVPAVEWNKMGYALVDVVLLPNVEELLPQIDLSARIDQIHIKEFTPAKQEVFIDADPQLSAVKLAHIVICGDIEGDSLLHAKVVKVIPYELVHDIVVENYSTLNPNEVVTITLNDIIDVLCVSDVNLSTVIGISIKQTVEVEDCASIQLAEANGVYLVTDIDVTLNGNIGTVNVQAFVVKQNIDVGIKYRIDPRKAIYIVLNHDVDVDNLIDYQSVEVLGMSSNDEIALTDECEMSLNRSAKLEDYADHVFADFGAKKFSELLRIVVSK